MSHSVEIKEGQNFQDGTGLTVRVGEIDAPDRVHFSVSGIASIPALDPEKSPI
jgi:hypothetical protein